MKVRSSVEKVCDYCYTIKRGKVLYCFCKRMPRHKQKQC